MFHEIMIDLREYRLRGRRLKWSRLYRRRQESLGQNNVQNTNGQRHYLANAVKILVLYFTLIVISVDLILG